MIVAWYLQQSAKSKPSLKKSRMVMPGRAFTGLDHQSITQYLTRADLEGFSKEEAAMARNEIYAQHGYNFRSENVRAYFESKSWYTAIPGVNADTFNTNHMNDCERANLTLIQNYEKEMGWK